MIEVLEKTKENENLMLPRAFRVKDLIWETGAGDIYTWELAAENGEPFYFKPGQFNMLYLHGVGEVPISISSDSESGKLVHTTRAVGSVTRAMQEVRIGDVIGLRGPFGRGWPVSEAQDRDVIIMCGGMGLPPLRPVIYFVLNHREKFKNVFLLYGARSPLEIVYKTELEKLHHEKNIQVRITADKKEGQWDGPIGVVPSLLDQIEFNRENALAMLCGPEIMMHYGRLGLNRHGVDDGRIFVSMERSMKCALGHCGHCQWGADFVCKDGPVYRFADIAQRFNVREL